MTGRTISEKAHRIEGTVVIGRALEPTKKLGSGLTRARKKDSAQIAEIKRKVRESGT